MKLPLRQKPSGVWIVDHAVDGKRRRTSTGTKDRAQAIRIARDIILGVNPAPAAQTPVARAAASGGIRTMSQLWDACLKTAWSPARAKSQRTVLSNIRVLTPLIGDEQVSNVTGKRLQALSDALVAKGYAPATVKRKMDAVGRSLTEAVRLGLLRKRPDMPLQAAANNYKERILSEAEEALVFDAIDRRAEREPARQWTRFRHLVRWLVDGGFRLSEPLQATAEWVQENRGRPFLAIPQAFTKSGKARSVPLSPAIMETLPYLTTTAVGGRLFPMTPATAWYLWNTIRSDIAATGKANIDDVVLHTLRHTCLTRLIRGGMRLHHVSKWAGHANTVITEQRYLKVDAGDLLDAYDSVK